jgi:hypothetical protein
LKAITQSIAKAKTKDVKMSNGKPPFRSPTKKMPRGLPSAPYPSRTMNKTILALLAFLASTNSFSPPSFRHISKCSRRTLNSLFGNVEGTSGDSENAEGGTQWIKDAMGSENQQQKSPTPCEKDEEFSMSDIQEMEELISEPNI